MAKRLDLVAWAQIHDQVPRDGLAQRGGFLRTACSLVLTLSSCWPCGDGHCLPREVAYQQGRNMENNGDGQD
jgi:hypothetical protein